MDDYISRQAAIRAAMKDVSLKRTHEFNGGCARAANNIKAVPAADVRPVKYGRWIELENPNYSPFDPTSREYELLCSRCGATHYGNDRNFCPNCGADMTGGVNRGTD